MSWKPIDFTNDKDFSPPKDGEFYDCIGPSWAEPAPLAWRPIERDGRPVYHWEDRSGIPSRDYTPTHWLDLSDVHVPALKENDES